MSKRKLPHRKRASKPSWLWPLLLLAVALVASWYLFRPLRHHVARHRPLPPSAAIAVATATPEAAQTPTPGASVATPEATVTPLESTSPPAVNPNGPKLALIIDDCGQWVDTERGFIALPVPLTLSVLPHVHAGTMIMQEAAAAGKGVMLHLPMETISGMNPGPGKVTTEMTDAQIAAQVEDDLAQVPLAKGVNNHEGSKASSDSRVMHDVIDVLAHHGSLFFVDSKTSAGSVGEQVAAAAGIPSASRDVFLDNKEDVAYSEAQLREAAAIAKRTGSAIAIGHPRPTTLEAVRALIPEFEAEGITFVLAQSLTH